MVCIQVYFEIPYAPYTRKTDFFPQRQQWTLSHNVYVQGNEGEKQIHNHSEIFHFL